MTHRVLAFPRGVCVSIQVRNSTSAHGVLCPLADNERDVVAGVKHVGMVGVQHSLVVEQQFAIQPQRVLRFPGLQRQGSDVVARVKRVGMVVTDDLLLIV